MFRKMLVLKWRLTLLLMLVLLLAPMILTPMVMSMLGQVRMVVTAAILNFWLVVVMLYEKFPWHHASSVSRGLRRRDQKAGMFRQ